MAIDSYDTLKAEVQRWCARSDSIFAARFPTFVAFTEDRLNDGTAGTGTATDTPALRSRVMEASTSLALTDGAAPLPEDVLAVRKLHVPGLTPGLIMLPPERFAVFHAARVSGSVPIYASVHGGAISVLPAVTGTVELAYYQRHPRVLVSSQTSPLLTAHGNLFLSGCLFEAFSFMQEPELALGHMARLRSGIEGANRAAAGGRFLGKMSVRSRTWIP